MSYMSIKTKLKRSLESLEDVDQEINNDLVDSQDEIARNIEISLESADRILDIAEGNMDIASVLRNKPQEEEITPTEQSLIQVAGNMAVSGSDENASDAIPAMESFTSRVAAIEAAEAKATTLVKQMFMHLQTTALSTAEYFKNYIPFIDVLKKEIEQARAHLDSLPTEDVMITVSATRMLLMGNGTVIDNYDEFSQASDTTRTTYENVLRSVKELLKGGFLRNLQTFLSLFSDNNLNDILALLREETTNVINSCQLELAENTWSHDVFMSQPLMGNKYLVVKQSTIHRNDQIQRRSIRDHSFYNYYTIDFDTGGRYEMGDDAGFTEVVSKRALQSHLDELERSVDALRSFKGFDTFVTQMSNFVNVGAFTALLAKFGGAARALYIALPLIVKTSRALRNLMFINCQLPISTVGNLRRITSHHIGIIKLARPMSE